MHSCKEKKKREKKIIVYYFHKNNKFYHLRLLHSHPLQILLFVKRLCVVIRVIDYYFLPSRVLSKVIDSWVLTQRNILVQRAQKQLLYYQINQANVVFSFGTFCFFLRIEAKVSHSFPLDSHNHRSNNCILIFSRERKREKTITKSK